ncbi:MAG: YncE family protein [Ignavibacteriales bacterium]
MLTNDTEAQLGQNMLESIANQTNVLTSAQIEVGGMPIEIYGSVDATYVANFLSNTVSVIDSGTNTVIKNIHVRDGPRFIEALAGGGAVYVANFRSNTVSVIDSDTNRVVKNITVGDRPRFIEALAGGGAVYVANSGSDSVSVIYPVTNEVVAGVTFNINPFEGGQIICNGLDAPINRYLYVSSGTECMAKPNNGYEFASWVETFDGNSTRTINASTPADSPLAALSDAFSNDQAASLTVNRFGNFTAYFKSLPPPVPAAYWASLFTVVVTALVGSLLIPAVVGWIKSKKQTSRLNSFHQQMPLVYGDGKLDKKDTNKLNLLNRNISDSYAAGKISNEQYTSLKNEVSLAYQEIFKKRISSITEQDLEAVNKIRNDIIDTYSNGKISNEHYTNLKNEISVVYREIFKKRISSIAIPDAEAVRKIKNDITDAYSAGKISELHYSLLSEQISNMLNHK